MSERYLVTGCAGFIASQVSRQLLDEGRLVVGVDSLNDAYDVRLKRWRLETLLGRPGFEFHQFDITDAEAIDRRFRDDVGRSGPYAAVVNLAARAGVRASMQQPQLYYRTNCEGTLLLLEACRRWEVRKFLLASTSSLYGSDNPLPFREDADTDRPLSPYAASKKAAETIAYAWHSLHGIDVTVVRYFTGYGPAGRPDMSVLRFIRSIAEGEPIVVYGDGSQRRDFTYIDDIARGTVAALKPLGYATLNLGGDHPVALSELIDHIARQLDRKPRIEHRPAHPADAPATWADIRRARELLGWSPQVPLEEGLGRTIAWYRENREMVLGLDFA